MSIKVGDKFIIEIGTIAELPDGKKKYFIKPFESLVFDKTGLAQLEPVEIELKKAKEIAYKNGLEDGNKIADKDLKEIQDSTYDVAYNKGLEDAWELIKAIDTNREFEKEVFGEDLDYDFDNVSVQDAIKKWKAYEVKKKAEEEIIKGDTVCFKSSPNSTFIVWDILDEGDEGILLYGFNQDGTYSSVNIKNVKKVNVPNCYSEVSQLLAKLRGEDND